MSLQGIEKLSTEEISQIVEKRNSRRNTQFTWHLPGREVTLGFNNGEFFSYVKFQENISQELMNCFLTTDSLVVGLKDFSYGNTPDTLLIKDSNNTKKAASGIKMSYYVHNTLPLQIEEEKRIPQKLASSEELYKLIKDKKWIFYTGAGLSINQVPGMEQLIENLGINKKEKTDELLYNLVGNPSLVEKKWKMFFDKMDNSKPSQGHEALAQIALKHNYKVITENLDALHQKTGIKPIVPHTDFFEKNTNDEIQNIDFIITVGLSHDDRGMIAYCKNINKNLQIISINPRIAEYLTNEDYQLSNDCQIILPELLALIEK